MLIKWVDNTWHVLDNREMAECQVKLSLKIYIMLTIESKELWFAPVITFKNLTIHIKQQSHCILRIATYKKICKVFYKVMMK